MYAMAIAKDAPIGTVCPWASPTRHPAHPLCGGVDGGPEMVLSADDAEFVGAGVTWILLPIFG